MSEVKPNRQFLAYATVLLLWSAVCTAEDQRQEEARSLIARAAETSAIRVSGSQPFRLTAQIRFDTSSGWQEGSYQLIWLSPTKWREALTLPGYSEVAVGGGGKVWLSRSLAFVPLRARQAEQALSLESRLFLGPDQKVKKIRSAKRKGIGMRCVEFEGVPWRELCVAAASGSVMRVENAVPEMRFEYMNPAAFGAKLYPASIVGSESGQKVLEITVKELTPIQGADESLFVPQQQAVERRVCEEKDVSGGKLVDKVFARYPDLSKMNRESGVVTVFALIGVDGRPRNLAVVRTAGSNLDRAALDAIAQWRYEPFRCGDVPIERELLIDTRFELSP